MMLGLYWKRRSYWIGDLVVGLAIGEVLCRMPDYTGYPITKSNGEVRTKNFRCRGSSTCISIFPFFFSSHDLQYCKLICDSA